MYAAVEESLRRNRETLAVEAIPNDPSHDQLYNVWAQSNFAFFGTASSVLETSSHVLYCPGEKQGPMPIELREPPRPVVRAGIIGSKADISVRNTVPFRINSAYSYLCLARHV